MFTTKEYVDQLPRKVKNNPNLKYVCRKTITNVLLFQLWPILAQPFLGGLSFVYINLYCVIGPECIREHNFYCGPTCTVRQQWTGNHSLSNEGEHRALIEISNKSAILNWGTNLKAYFNKRKGNPSGILGGLYMSCWTKLELLIVSKLYSCKESMIMSSTWMAL